MKVGVKRTTPVVWTEIKFKFWHWVSTLQATTPQPGPLFIPKQDRRTSLKIPNHLGFWKVGLVKVDFPPFWHPFCWFSLREMGQNAVSDQLLGRFTPILLQWYLSKEHHWYKNVPVWCIRWWDTKNVWWNVGFTPRAIWHGLHYWLLSRLGVAKVSEQGLPLGTEFQTSQLWRPY